MSTPADPQWNSYVQAPLRIGAADAERWDEAADVVVVGFGGAGACAAIEARAHGAEVLTVDRFEGGGATALSGGVYYGGGTRFQREAGFNDTPEEMYRYLKLEVGDAISDATLRKFCQESSANLEWLMSHGVRFGSKAYDGKRSYPPAGYDIYYSGNETLPGYAEHARPAPRGHRVVGPDYTGGVLYQHLRDAAVRAGVRVLEHAPVMRLIVDENDVVVGVEANVIPPQTAAWHEHRKLIRKVNKWQRFFEQPTLRTGERIEAIERESARPLRLRARRGVVLSTGSFSFNREMVAQYAPKFREAMPLGTIGCDGSGIRLGQTLGGATGCMESVSAWRAISPPITFVQGIIVDVDGRRFVSEEAYLGRIGLQVSERKGGRAWVIIDRESYKKSFKDTLPVRGAKWIDFSLPLLINLLSNNQKGSTPRELAARAGISPEGLEATVAEYNRTIASGTDVLGKSKRYLRQLGPGPYYAIDISMGSKKFPCPSIPMGGLNVDETTGHVMRADGSRIAGLFAAGRAAKGIPSGFYVSGTSIADCVFAGRRAGLNAAQGVAQLQSSSAPERARAG